MKNDCHLRLGSLSVRLHYRGLIVGTCLLVVTGVVGVTAMLLGDYPMQFFDVISALMCAEQDPLVGYFVRDQRAPRVMAAVAVGAALGVSGNLFQTMSANPLGSPDIIGFSTGAATGALIQIIVFNTGPAGVAIGAILGGIFTAIAVYLFSWENGVAGYRLVLVGIGVAAVLQGFNSLLIVRASLTSAQTAAQWLAGSFNATSWDQSGALLLGIATLLACGIVLSRPLSALVLGDDTALGLGIRTERLRCVVVLVGVGLVALCVAVAGPISFVALAAPQLALRLTRGGNSGMIVAAEMGALIVLVSDIVAQRLFAPTQLPVGVVTGSLGGIYLVWLLVRERRNK